MRTGFYELADKYSTDAESALGDDSIMHEIFEYPENLMVEPISYLHGACDMFAWFLAREHGYGIRAYHTIRPGYQDLLVHAVCFQDAGGCRHWIDIRGVTDDEDEMLMPFVRDIALFEHRGYQIAFADFAPGVDGLSSFVSEFTDPNRDFDAFSTEVEGLLAEEMLGIYVV